MKIAILTIFMVTSSGITLHGVSMRTTQEQTTEHT